MPIANAHFGYMIWFMISEKSIIMFTFLHQRGASILSKSRNFKTFLKEDYANGLGSSYLFTKTMLSMELNMIFVVLMKFACISHS